MSDKRHLTQKYDRIFFNVSLDKEFLMISLECTLICVFLRAFFLLKKLKLKLKLIENFPSVFLSFLFFFISYKLETNYLTNKKRYKKEILFLSFVIFNKFQKIF